ncbi:MAG TPA: hypothetical protein PKB10_15600, partial [Tepidisphaeraceae bacterium]|nr:hypothetical protein [Tepidisphaeraceae bacterium]
NHNSLRAFPAREDRLARLPRGTDRIRQPHFRADGRLHFRCRPRGLSISLFPVASFRWTDWNIEHIAEHGVFPEEAEQVVLHPAAGFPRLHHGDRWIAWGQTSEGWYLQVVYVIEEGEDEDEVFVIHARPLTANEKRRLHRRKR